MKHGIARTTDGMLIEVEFDDQVAERCSSSSQAKAIGVAYDGLSAVLEKIASPFIATYRTLSTNVELAEAEIKLGLAFEAEGEVDDTPYWDEHSLNEQRFYNTVCLIYGSDPDAWDDLVGEDDLPEERAEQCPDEYKQISTSWNRLLKPFLTVPTVRVKLGE